MDTLHYVLLIYFGLNGYCMGRYIHEVIPTKTEVHYSDTEYILRVILAYFLFAAIGVLIILPIVLFAIIGVTTLKIWVHKTHIQIGKYCFVWAGGVGASDGTFFSFQELEKMPFACFKFRFRNFAFIIRQKRRSPPTERSTL